MLHMAVHTALMLAAVWAIGTLEAWFLSALHVEMLLEIALPAIHLAAPGALKAPR